MISDLLLEKYRILRKKNEPNIFATRNVRDLTVCELTDDLWLIIACDSDGGIGPKKNDTVYSPAYDVGRFGARVPLMELLASGAVPFIVVDTLCVEMNPTGKDIIQGVRDEAVYGGLTGNSIITGSTEDNVTTHQTGIGVTVIGVVHKNDFKPGSSKVKDAVVCIGIPKSAPEFKLTLNDNDIADSKLIKQLSTIDYIHDILPVGSKGIVHEFHELAASSGLVNHYSKNLSVDITKSG